MLDKSTVIRVTVKLGSDLRRVTVTKWTIKKAFSTQKNRSASLVAPVCRSGRRKKNLKKLFGFVFDFRSERCVTNASIVVLVHTTIATRRLSLQGTGRVFRALKFLLPMPRSPRWQILLRFSIKYSRSHGRKTGNEILKNSVYKGNEMRSRELN